MSNKFMHNIVENTVNIYDLIDAVGNCSIMGEAPHSGLTALTDDSRAVVPGSVFVAVRGIAADGHRYIDAAAAAGATVIVAEELPQQLPTGPEMWVRVPDSRRALACMAARWYGDPSESLTLIGVTGTNGKTTVATLLYKLARAMGYKAGLLSTVVNMVDEEAVPADHTTPHPLLLNKLLRRMVDAGCTFAAMEVSSHAADQQRIAALDFDGAVFTNLSRDHLDYHKTVDAYLHAKKSFFDGLQPHAFALVNADDRNGAVMLQNSAAAHKATFSLRGSADFNVRVVEDRLDGMLLEFDGTAAEVPFVGRFNAANLATVYGAAVLTGWERHSVITAMSGLMPVAGRFQPFRSTDGVTAIVDFAHTPDAIANVLDTIAETAPEGSEVWCVCGAGGNRDAGKRPLMAQAADARCNHLVLTSDNPRDENPDEIIAQMLAGLSQERRRQTLTIVDRRQAIRHAIGAARPGDVVLVAGKGHETEQIIAGTSHHFDDREEVRAALDERTCRPASNIQPHLI